MDRLRAAAGRLAERCSEVEQVQLFGSLARGDAVPGSDADILVVLAKAALPFAQRASRYALTGCGIGVDVFAYTRVELKQLAAQRPRFHRAMLDEGIALYQRSAQEP